MTTPPIRLAINGASGRMGSALLALLRDDPRFELVHAVVAPGSADDGQPVNVRPGAALRFAHDWAGAPALDAMIDFSGPAALDGALTHCLAHGIALVSGTTGLDAAMETRLAQAGERFRRKLVQHMADDEQADGLVGLQEAGRDLAHRD